MSDSKRAEEIRLRSREISPRELEELALVHASRQPKKHSPIDLLRESGSLHWRSWGEIRAQKDTFIQQVRELLAETGLEEVEKRLSIASVLCRLGVAEALDHILPQLKNVSLETRRQAIWAWDAEACPPRNEAEQELLFSLLYDEDSRISRGAVDCCCKLKCHQVEEVFKKRLAAPNPPDPGSIIRWLCTHAASTLHIEMAAEFLSNSPTGHDTWLACLGLQDIIRKDHPVLAPKALLAFEDFFLHSSNPYKYCQGSVRLLKENGTARALPAFELIFAEATDSTSRSYALDSIARFKPERALELLKLNLKTSYLYLEFQRCFHTSANEQHWDALATMVREALTARLKDLHWDRHIVELLLGHGGERSRALVRERLPEMWPNVHMHAQWGLNRWTLQDVFYDLKQRGMLEALPDASVIETVLRRDGNPYATEADLLESVLREINVLRPVSSEPDYFPPDHSDLLVEFSGATNGVYAPRFCRQTVSHRQRADSAAVEEIYEVSFVSGNRLFQFEAWPMSEYHVGSVELAVNKALELAQEQQRLIRIPSDAGFSVYLFGEPEKIRQFCHAFAIPIADERKHTYDMRVGEAH